MNLAICGIRATLLIPTIPIGYINPIGKLGILLSILHVLSQVYGIHFTSIFSQKKHSPGYPTRESFHNFKLPTRERL
jgi:hypothetical protein